MVSHLIPKMSPIARHCAAVPRPAHLARLQALQDEGRLLTAGPNPTIDAEDPVMQVLPAAPSSPSLLAGGRQSSSRCRPYVAAGVYAKVTIKPFKKVFWTASV